MSNLSDREPRDRIFLGAIADDVTGASDLAINLVKGGLRVVQILKVPTAEDLEGLDCDAVVVALKTRSIPVAEAVRQSVAAVEALRNHGCQRFFFKYCSTFDSTPQGNIGPVADALMKTLGVPHTIACPAFPAAGRTVYQGHLFVGDQLLHESGMQHHPLNPMTDANLVRWAQAQSENQVGLVPLTDVRHSADAVAARIEQQKSIGRRLLVTDCCDDDDLTRIAAAIGDDVLVTGGSGIGRYLPDAWRKSSQLTAVVDTPSIAQPPGRRLIIAGSCSAATRQQVACLVDGKSGLNVSAFRVDVEQLTADYGEVFDRAIATADADDPESVALIYSTPAKPSSASGSVEQQQRTSELIETFHANVAEILVAQFGFGTIIVAGGETSGAVVNALGIDRLRVGPEICTGVPWLETCDDPSLAIALKSGNFGDEAFFETALSMLQGEG